LLTIDLISEQQYLLALSLINWAIKYIDLCFPTFSLLLTFSFLFLANNQFLQQPWKVTAQVEMFLTKLHILKFRVIRSFQFFCLARYLALMIYVSIVLISLHQLTPKEFLCYSIQLIMGQYISFLSFFLSFFLFFW
jgi:hypothetical protein